MVDEYSDDDVVARVRWRLENVEPLLITAQEMGEKAPFWAIARILFPVAESLAWLLHAEENTGTSARLSWLLREVLSNRKSAYRDMASIICQVWRHGLTHGDEPPLLVIDSPMTASGERETSNAKAMSWKLALGAVII